MTTSARDHQFTAAELRRSGVARGAALFARRGNPSARRALIEAAEAAMPDAEEKS